MFALTTSITENWIKNIQKVDISGWLSCRIRLLLGKRDLSSTTFSLGLVPSGTLCLCYIDGIFLYA